MPASIASATVDKFDDALDQYMRQAVGEMWRTKCHQSAKIAAKALARLYPNLYVEMRRVELIARMEGAPRYVHIGWLHDPHKIDGKAPVHFAVAVGQALYDPTLGQLHYAKTPLDIPPEAHFFEPSFFSRPVTAKDGFRWGSAQRPLGLLHVGYKMQPAKVPSEVMRDMMSDEEAREHARKVVDIFRAAAAVATP